MFGDYRKGRGRRRRNRERVFERLDGPDSYMPGSMNHFYLMNTGNYLADLRLYCSCHLKQWNDIYY